MTPASSSPALAFPKPVRPKKEPKPLRRKKPLWAKELQKARIQVVARLNESLDIEIDQLLFPKPLPRKRVPKPLKSGRKHDPKMNAWHDAVVAKGFDPQEQGHRCFHCGEYFTREYVVGDHFPLQKGKHPELRHDPAAGVCSCVPCNDGGSPYRVASVRFWRTTGFILPVWERGNTNKKLAAIVAEKVERALSRGQNHVALTREEHAHVHNAHKQALISSQPQS